MSKCVYCKGRKGKRSCPALGGTICSQCCGEHRLLRIACPSDCEYLDTSSDYQQKRAGEQFALARKEFYKSLFAKEQEKGAALFNFIETVTFSYFGTRRDGQDGEIIAALQSLRRTLSPLHIPAAPAPVFAEHLKREYEAFSKQKEQPVPDAGQTTELLDKAIQFVTEFSGGSLQSRRFLNGLVGYIKTFHPQIAEYLSKQHEGGRIVLPGRMANQLTPPVREPSGGGLHHTHGPDCGHHH
jgi:hypothetical protein